MELCDLYTAAGQRTGRTVARGTPVAPGEYYLVVHVWVRDEAGHYLIQQRAAHVTDPGVWAITAGYVQAGEASLAAAQRETHEELGLRLPAAALQRWARLPLGHRLEDLWLARVQRAALGPPTPGPEVMACRWVDPATLQHLVATGGFFRYSYFDDLPA